MKTLSQKHILLYTALSLIAGLLLAVLRTVISDAALERGVELYAQGTVADDVLHIATAICVLILFSSMLLPYSRNPAADIRRTSPLTVFAATFTGFMILAFDLILLYNNVRGNWVALAPLLGKPATGTVTMASAAFLFCLMLTAIPAAIFFFKVAAVDAWEKPSFPVFSTFSIVFFTLFALHVYFDTTTAMNSPMQIMRMLSLLSFVLYAIHETRRILGIPMPRWYFVFAFSALLFGTVVTLSDAILYVKGVIRLTDGFLGVAIGLAYLVYILSRLLYLGMTKPTQASIESDT